MDNETARLRERIAETLTPAKNRGFYLCPLCGSGQGQNQTGALHLCDDKLHVKCFSCGFYGDLFDLIGSQYGLLGAQRFQKARELLGTVPPSGVGALAATSFASLAAPADFAPQKRLTPPADFSDYIRRCAAALPAHPEALAYLTGRGLSHESITAFSLGYDEAQHQLVIPYDGAGGYFIRRSLGADKRFFKPPTSQAGPEPLFGGKHLYAPGVSCVFVVESQLCAISLAQAGGAAVALGGGGAKRLLAQLTQKPTSAVLALAPDNDDQGRRLGEALAQELEKLGCAYHFVNPAGSYKDPNEALQHEPDAFARRVRACRDEALAGRALAEREEQERYAAASAAGQLDDFLREIDARAGERVLSTGFPALDAALGGGLYEGLHILGALSSLGKTTFALQLACQIAAQGRDVLFFSLEMSRQELAAKTLSRLSREDTGGETANTLTAREVLAGRWRQVRGGEALAPALQRYREFAACLFIREGGPDMTVNALWAAAREHQRLRGCPPVLVVDYLQILAPLDMRATDKQNTDRAVFELKRLSREMNTPVLAISSLNRENYTARMSMSAFKESGAIEYSSDVLLGLQFRLPPGADKISPEALEGMKQAEPRELELKVLKNRNGPGGAAVEMDYLPKYNLFIEKGGGGAAKRR